jgi:hypothetical protein
MMVGGQPASVLMNCADTALAAITDSIIDECGNVSRITLLVNTGTRLDPWTAYSEERRR